jgi:nephrocystin-3
MPNNKPLSDQIRVFISSTFQDMKQERDYLVKFIFPKLKNMCDTRGIIWSEVDLRWGVLDEQVAERNVLPICLEEIRRCRPYFIGILGERYGWIPDSVPQEIIDKEPWLKEHLHNKKSVTELEILHGVLNNPEMAEHAFFYFRGPTSTARIKPEKKLNFVCEDKINSNKLKILKNRIRQSGFPVRENYADPKALGELVLKDFTELIDRLFPENEISDPLEREAFGHEVFAQCREKVYIGRPEYFERLDIHAESNGTEPLVILGESGSGKSALLANWVAHYREKHPDIPIIQHYIGATPYSSDWAAMLRRIMGELKRKFDIGQEIPNKSEELRSTFPNWLYMAGAKGRAILVLDALNQLEDKEGALDLVWLPLVMPENVKLVVSTLPRKSLNEIAERKWPFLEVTPLIESERQKLISDFLNQYSKSLNSERAYYIASAPQCSNPLYLRVLLDELRQFGDYQKLDERIDYYLKSESINDLYCRVIERWSEDYNSGIDLVHQSLILLWAARRGLSETELLKILGMDDNPLPQSVWSPLYLAMSDSLVSRAGLLNFANEFLRIAVDKSCLPTESEKRNAHIRLADYFGFQSSSFRRTDEFPWQLAEGSCWQRLYNILVDEGFFQEVCKQNRYDTKSYWVRIEDLSPLTMVNAYRRQIEHPDQIIDKEFLWCIGTILNDMGYPEEANNIYISLSKIARELGNFNSLQNCINQQAHIFYSTGHPDDAMKLYRESEDICRQLENYDGLKRALGGQALILQTQGDIETAMAIFREMGHISRKIGDPHGLQVSYCNIANICKIKGKIKAAIRLYKKEEHLCREIGDLVALAHCFGNQALILYTQGNLNEANDLFREEEMICRKVGDMVGISMSLGNQALISKAKNDFKKALSLHIEEESICRKIGDLAGEQACLGNLGTLLFELGDIENAIIFLKEQELISRKLGDKAELAISLGNQANIHYIKEDYNRAMDLCKEKEQICRQIGNLGGLVYSLGIQAAILRAWGEKKAAMMLYEETYQISKELGNAETSIISLINQASLYSELNEKSKATSLGEEAYQLAIGRGYSFLAKQIEPVLENIRLTTQDN